MTGRGWSRQNRIPDGSRHLERLPLNFIDSSYLLVQQGDNREASRISPKLASTAFVFATYRARAEESASIFAPNAAGDNLRRTQGSASANANPGDLDEALFVKYWKCF